MGGANSSLFTVSKGHQWTFSTHSTPYWGEIEDK